MEDSKANKQLRDEYALEIAKHLGWREIKDAHSLWSNGKLNPKTTTTVIRMHRSTQFLVEQINKRGLSNKVSFWMLSDNIAAKTNVLKVILDDIRKE